MSGLFRSEMTLTGAGEPERLEGFTLMDRDAFDILGVTPARGRLFLPEEYQRGSASRRSSSATVSGSNALAAHPM